MHSTAETERHVPRPDVKRWSESSSIRRLAKGKRPTTFGDVQFALSWWVCAFIIRSFAVNRCVMFLSVESWSESCKLLMSIKLNSRTFKGEHLCVQCHETMFLTQFLDRSLKPVPQFVIPPINVATPTPSSNKRRDSSSEPSEPKRIRLDDETSSPNHEAQHSDMINTVINALVNNQLENAQQPRSTEVM